MGEGDHDGHAVVVEPQQVETFELGSESPAADVFDNPDSVIRVDNLFAYLKVGHTRTNTPRESSVSYTNHPGRVMLSPLSSFCQAICRFLAPIGPIRSLRGRSGLLHLEI